MARDAFATFNNSKFEPYNSFKVNCVGYNQFKGLWESLYNRDLALLVALWTSRPCAQREKFFEGGGLGHRWGGTSRGGQVQQGGGLTSDARCPPPSPPQNETLPQKIWTPSFFYP